MKQTLAEGSHSYFILFYFFLKKKKKKKGKPQQKLSFIIFLKKSCHLLHVAQ